MHDRKDRIHNIKKNQVDLFIMHKNGFDTDCVFLYDTEIDQLKKINNKNRKIEFIGIRYIRNLFFPEFEIHYHESGKPFIISPNHYISISHSRNYLGFSVAPFPIGLDIEECDKRVLKIKDRFLNLEEKKIINEESIIQLTSAWCIKESLYKLNCRSGIDFKEELIISDLKKNFAITKMLDDEGWRTVKLITEKIDDLIISVNIE